MSESLLEQPKLTRQEQITQKNRRLGMAIFQASWIMVFVCLIVVNLQIRGNFPTWPPEGIAKLGIGIPSVATVVLLISVFTAHRAVKQAEAGRNNAFAPLWLTTLGLGAAFVAMMVWEWLNAPMTQNPLDPGQQYGVVFRMMTGYHMLHALVIGLYMFSTYQKRAALTPRNTWAAESGAKLWYFVVAAWIMFYVVLYWI